MLHTLAFTAQPDVIGATDILEVAALIAVAMLAAVASYRGMQRPRIVLTEVEPGVFRAARPDVVRYVIAAPFLVAGWNLLLLVILTVAANELNGDSIVVASSAVVLAARAFAHLSPERSHELAKTVPLTLVTLVLITGGVRNEASFDSVLSDLDRLTITPQATALLLIAELVITTAWYWVGVRWWWVRGHDVPGLPRHSVRDDHLRRLEDGVAPYTFDSH